LDRFEERTLLSAVTWTGGAGDNNWDTASNWSDDAVPTAADDVVIGQTGAAVTLSGTDTANNLNSQDAIVVTGSLSVAGTCTTNNTLNVAGTLTGGGTIAAYGGIVFAGGATLDGVTVDNDGTATVTSGGIEFLDSAEFNNLAGATFDSQIDGPIGNVGDAGTFNNAGTFTKSAGTGVTAVGVPFNNSGTATVSSGTLAFQGGGTSTGSFTGATGTTLDFGGNQSLAGPVSGDTVTFVGHSANPTVNLSGTYSAATATSIGGIAVDFNGQVISVGALAILSGTADFNPATPVTLTVPSLSVEYSNYGLTGTDSFVVTGPFNWTSAWISGSGTIDAYGGVGPFGGVLLNGMTLNNYATATQSGSDFGFANNAVFNNLAGATFDSQIDGPIGNVGDAGAFNNAGTFTKSAGTASGSTSFGVPLNNSGEVVVQSGNLAFGESAVNSGTVTVDSGTDLTETGYLQTSGSTILMGGSLSGGAISISGGSLSGSGVINANVTDNAQVIPGGAGAAGLLTINGNYTQTAAGALDIELGGANAGSQYDQLAVSGTASLGGTVNVSLINGFQPALGNSFQPLTFTSSVGNFAYYNGIVLGDRLILDPALNPSKLTLTVQPAVTSATLSAPSSPSVSGQGVTFTAAVTVALPPTTIDPVPTGTVAFYDNGQSIGVATLSVINGQDQATFTTSTLSAASHSITAAYTSGDGNFVPSPVSAAVTQVVNKASTSTTLATSTSPSVYGQTVTFTAIVTVVSPGSTAVASPTGAVTFYDNGTSIGTGTLSVVNGQDQVTFSTSALSTATHPITAAYTSGDGNFNASAHSASVSQVVNQDSTTTTAGASPNSANLGQLVTFTATVTANAPGSGMPTGSIDFFDTTTNTDLTPGGVPLSSSTATFSTSSLTPGTHTIRASYSGDTDFITSTGSTGTITIGQSIIVLDPTASGALSLSTNASITLRGGVYVDSSSSSALSASGNAKITASVIDVHGGVQKSGNASFSPVPVTGAASIPDPLAALPAPSTSGLTNYGSESLSGNSSATIKPGIYTGITLSGNAKLTMNSGIYIIQGGGFSVSLTASVSGSGVLIVNAGSNYPSTGGTYGSIALSGTGSYSLSPSTTGTYAGIVIFQPRDNTKAVTISANAAGLTGTIYAPSAQLAESGSGQVNAAIIADTMTISGNGVANVVTLNAPTGKVAPQPTQIGAAYGINGASPGGSRQTIASLDAGAVDALLSDPGMPRSLLVLDGEGVPIKRKLFSLLA